MSIKIFAFGYRQLFLHICIFHLFFFLITNIDKCIQTNICAPNTEMHTCKCVNIHSCYKYLSPKSFLFVGPIQTAHYMLRRPSELSNFNLPLLPAQILSRRGHLCSFSEKTLPFAPRGNVEHASKLHARMC